MTNLNLEILSIFRNDSEGGKEGGRDRANPWDPSDLKITIFTKISNTLWLTLKVLLYQNVTPTFFPSVIISNFHFICSWLSVAPLLMSYSGPRGRHWDNKNMEKLAAARLQIEQKSSETFWQKFNLSNIQPKSQDPHPFLHNPCSLDVCASSLNT